MRRSQITAVSLLILLSACGGGGGGGGGSSATNCPTPVGSGSVVLPPGNAEILGTLKVAPLNGIEVEQNNSLGTAQPIAAGESIFGANCTSDSGYRGIAGRTNVVLQDLYKVSIAGENIRIVLTMADDNTSTQDLDLFLLDSSGTMVVTSSEGSDQVIETVSTPGPGTYYIGIRAFSGQSPYLLSAGSTTTSSSGDRDLPPVGAKFVAGELIVKVKSVANMQAQAAKLNLAPAHHVWNDAYLMKLIKSAHVTAAQRDLSAKINAPGHEENEAIAATLEALRKLNRDPAVQYAEPNYLRHPSAIPNDEFYKYQWHYPAINLPQAWDIAGLTPGAGTVVAVIDTGILSGHPDLQGQLLLDSQGQRVGYDFISSATNAADGNGIDSDPEDPGDGARPGDSSFHGTHVAGTIAAATNNNGLGVAGIAWNSKIMPLRVLGRSGGTDADIIEAMKFAARLNNASGTLPATKADVINMSLGGAGSSTTTQSVITAVRNAGVIIVAAAGNENSSNESFPASYDGVISVSAVAFDLKRAPYSNFGSKIDIAAPGGDTSADLNGDTFADGVLSTLLNDSTNPPRFNYVFYQGTSMASPHIAGVVALMRGLHPSLTPSDLDQLIAGIHPTFTERITTDLGEPGRDNLFGHGLIDASKAATAAKALAGNPTPTGSVLGLSAANLDFDSFLNSLNLSISNAGSGTLMVTSISDDQSWLTVNPTTGTAPFTVNVTVDRTGLADGTYTGIITVASDAASGAATKQVTVTLRVSASAATGDVGEVFMLLIDPNTGKSVAQDETNSAEGYRYGFSGVPDGLYELFAGTDRDNDGFICDVEDACGTLGRTLTVTAGAQINNLDFPLNNAQNNPQSLRKRTQSSSPKKLIR